MSDAIVINSMYFNVLFSLLKGGKWKDKMTDMLKNGVFVDERELKDFENGLTDYLLNP